LGFLDALLWNVPPETLVGDALWFSVFAVMCRVHSLALAILVVSQVATLYIVIGLHQGLRDGSFELVRYGHYGAAMLTIVCFAYALDEQSRLRCFGQLMSLQDKNSMLAERLLLWKVLADSGQGDDPSAENWRASFRAWQPPALSPDEDMVSSGCSVATPPLTATSSTALLESPALLKRENQGGLTHASGMPSRAAREFGVAGHSRVTAGRSVRFNLPTSSSPEMKGRVPAPTTRPLSDLAGRLPPACTSDFPSSKHGHNAATQNTDLLGLLDVIE